jgi:hypothetical protein
MSKDPRRLGDVLQSGALADLGREAERRRTATVEIRALLPAEEASHLVSASRNAAGELVLVMDSPAWAARVRYAVANWQGGPVRIRVLPRGSA